MSTPTEAKISALADDNLSQHPSNHNNIENNFSSEMVNIQPPPPIRKQFLENNYPTNAYQFKEPEMDLWYVMFEMLLQFCIDNNHCNVPIDFNVTLNDGYVLRLGVWLQSQRDKKKTGLLSDEKSTILQSLVDSGKLSWEIPFSNSSSSSSSASALPTISSTAAPETFLPTVQVLNLRPAGSSQHDDITWHAYFDALSRFCQQYGHCNITKDTEYALADGTVVKLGQWLELQRIHRLHGELQPVRLHCLQYFVNAGKLQWEPIVGNPAGVATGNSSDSDGAKGAKAVKEGEDNGDGDGAQKKKFRRTMGSDEKWMMAFEALVKYGEQNGTCNVPYKV